MRASGRDSILGEDLYISGKDSIFGDGFVGEDS